MSAASCRNLRKRILDLSYINISPALRQNALRQNSSSSYYLGKEVYQVGGTQIGLILLEKQRK